MAPIPRKKRVGYNLDSLTTTTKKSQMIGPINKQTIKLKDSNILKNKFLQERLDPKQELLSEFADISYQKPSDRPKEYKGYIYDDKLSTRDVAVYYNKDNDKEFRPAIISYRGTDITGLNKRAIQDIGQDLLIATNIAGITKLVNPRYIQGKEIFDKTTEKYGRTEITAHSLGSRIGYETALSLDSRKRGALDKATLFSLPFGPLGAITTNLGTNLISDKFTPTKYASEKISQQGIAYREGKDKSKIFEKIDVINPQYDIIGSFLSGGRIKNTKLAQYDFSEFSLNPFNTIVARHKIPQSVENKLKDEL